MLSSTEFSIQYVPNGVTVTFAFPYMFLAEAQLIVTVTSALGVDTIQVLNIDYAVTGEEDPAGGSITFVTAPVSGTTLTITRIVDITQLIDYIANDDFPAETHEQALDRLTMICQQLASGTTSYGRAIRVPLTEPAATDLVLPLERGNMVLAFDADGNADTTSLADLIASVVDTAGSSFSVGVVTGTATIKSCTFSLVGTGPFKIRVWIVDGTASAPTLSKTLTPPDGNTVIEWDVLTSGGDAVVTLQHEGASSTWKVCAECQGVVIMSPIFTLGV